jgi:site-specific DNA-methyltransferase (cytosine-N4-specific)
MAEIPDESVDCLITSTPFLALRSYLPDDHKWKHLEIGSEATPAAFLSTLLALTREWRRVLTPHGSICVELGDTYSGANGWGDDVGNDRYPKGRSGGANRQQPTGPGWPLPKSLCLIPSLYAASLAYGHNLLDPDDRIDPWRIRNQIVWHRPNPPVGALGDKVRPSTSYITVACTSAKRWFDLDAERTAIQHPNATHTPAIDNGGSRQPGNTDRYRGDALFSNPAGAPPLDCWIDGDVWTIPTDEPAPRSNTHRRTAKGVDQVPRSGKSSDRGGNWSTMPELGETAPAPPLDAWFGDDLGTASDVWTIPTQPYKGAHYATYPIALPRRLINLMCPRQVCTTCGEPRRRMTSVEYEPHGVKNPNESRLVNADHPTNPSAQGMAHGRATKKVDTLGWTDCGHDTWRRGHILDPFAGSGTTGAAATEAGRDCTLIDIDDRNTWLIRERVGLFLEEVT